MRKKKYYCNKQPQRKIIYGKGKGKEYSDVSREIEQAFFSWLEYARIDTTEFEQRLKGDKHKVEESINGDGDIEINIYAGESQIIVPLVYQVNGGSTLDEFLVNALLLLSYVASKYKSESFDKAVNIFAERMVEEKKLSL